MNKFHLDVFSDLHKVLKKMGKLEEQENTKIFSDEVWFHLSLTMEHVSGKIGITKEEIDKYNLKNVKGN